MKIYLATKMFYFMISRHVWSWKEQLERSFNWKVLSTFFLLHGRSTTSQIVKLVRFDWKLSNFTISTSPTTLSKFEIPTTRRPLVSVEIYWDQGASLKIFIHYFIKIATIIIRRFVSIPFWLRVMKIEKVLKGFFNYQRWSHCNCFNLKIKSTLGYSRKRPMFGVKWWTKVAEHRPLWSLHRPLSTILKGPRIGEVLTVCAKKIKEIIVLKDIILIDISSMNSIRLDCSYYTVSTISNRFFVFSTKNDVSRNRLF